MSRHWDLGNLSADFSPPTGTGRKLFDDEKKNVDYIAKNRVITGVGGEWIPFRSMASRITNIIQLLL